MERKLTGKEKETIRNSFCWRCGAVPPFADGSRCHPHRIIPGCDGGEYVVGNVVPRCPPCHDIEHGGTGNPPLIGAASIALPQHRRVEVGRKGARALWDSMTPTQRKKFVKARRSGFEKMTPARRSEISRMGGRARAEKLSPKRLKEIAQLAKVSRTPEERRRTMLKAQPWLYITTEHQSAAGIKGTHVRWHIRRGIISQTCTLCTQGG